MSLSSIRDRLDDHAPEAVPCFVEVVQCGADGLGRSSVTEIHVDVVERRFEFVQKVMKPVELALADKDVFGPDTDAGRLATGFVGPLAARLGAVEPGPAGRRRGGEWPAAPRAGRSVVGWFRHCDGISPR